MTLIEILCVVALLVVLLATLIPLGRRLSQKAAVTRGVHHASILTAAGISYAQEHHGVFPKTDWSSYPDSSGYTTWVNQIAPTVYGDAARQSSNGSYLVNEIFRCPLLSGYKKLGKGWHAWAWNNVDWLNVLSQRNPSGGYWYPNLLTAPWLSKMPFLISSDKNDGTAGLTDSDADFNKYLPPSVWMFNGGVIVGYCDGHVEVIKNPSRDAVFKRQ